MLRSDELERPCDSDHHPQACRESRLPEMKRRSHGGSGDVKVGSRAIEVLQDGHAEGLSSELVCEY